MSRNIWSRILASVLLFAMVLPMIPVTYALTEETQESTFVFDKETDSTQTDLAVEASGIQEKSVPTRALDRWDVYYQTVTGHVFETAYTSDLEVEPGSSFNAIDLDNVVNDNQRDLDLKNVTVVLHQGDPAKLGADGVTITVDRDASIGSGISVDVYEYGVYICTYSFEVADPHGGLFAGGFGTADRPFLIKNAEQFRNIEYYSTKHFLLIDDICLGDMTPIPVFSGQLDGFGYELYGWSHEYYATGNMGLFLETKSISTIKNLTLSNCTLKAKDGKDGIVYVGLLCGANYGRIENVRVTNSYVHGDMGKWENKNGGNCQTYAGGICGRNYGKIFQSGVDNSTVYAYAASKTQDAIVSSCAGGIAGAAENGAKFEDVYAYDNELTTKAQGETYWEWFQTKGAYCYASPGGIAGYTNGTVTMKNVLGYNNDVITSREGKGGSTNAGSLVGDSAPSGTLTITNGYSEQEDGNHVGAGSLASGSTVNKVKYLCAEGILDQLSGFSKSIWVQSGPNCPKDGEQNATTHIGARKHLTIAQPERIVTIMPSTYEKDSYNSPLLYAPYLPRYDADKDTVVYYATYGGHTVAGFDCSKLGKQTITVTYGPLSTTVDVEIIHTHVPGAAADCTTDQVCTKCGEILQNNFGHKYVTRVVNSSCEESGYTVYSCTVCGFVHNDDFTTPTGHQLGADYACTVCGKQFEVPLREYSVFVCDAETTKPVPNALVTIGETAVYADEEGVAKFQLPDSTQATLKVSAQDYPDYENKNFAVSQMPCTYVYLASAKSGITEAWCNGDNVLVVDSQINCKTPALSAKIVVAGRAEANILKYQLVQGDQVIATSTNGEFIVANPHFLQNKPVYARMYTDGQNGFNMFERELNISVVGFQLNLELDDLLPFSAGLDIDFENGMPLLDGVSFQLPDIDLGENGFFNFSVKNEKAIFTFGMEEDSFDKDLDDKSPKEIMKQLRNKFKQQNNPKAWPKGKPKSEVSVSGAIILEFSKDAKVTSTYGEVHIGYELSYKWGKTFVVWIVPVYAGFKAGLEGELVLTEFGYDFENSEILIPDVDTTIQAEIAAYGGVGCSLVSAGIYGAVGGEIKMGIKDFQEYFRYKLYGEMGLYARVDLFFWKELEYRYPLLYGEFFGPNGQLKKSILSPESYETASRDYLENRSPWLASPMIPKRGVADSHALLQTSSYHAIEPRIVTSGDTIMMLFLDDDGSEGFNYQHLRYSLFDKDSNSWGEPKRVDDAEFADLEYDVYADASGIYLAYTKPGAITEENKEDFSAIMAGVEVYTAKYDPETQAFTDHTNVSCNDTLDSQPQITKDTVVWVNNFTNDGLAQNANNVLMLAKKTGSTWSDATALDEHGATVSSMDMGVLDGKPYVAVIRDVDCDLMTDTDRRLELLDTDGNVIQVTNSAGNEAKQEMVDHNGDVYYMTEGARAIEGVRFEQVDGQDVVQWYGHENIWQISTANATPVSLLENPEQGLTGEFKFVRIDENKSMILFAKNSVEDQKAGSSLYAIYYTDGQWGDPVPLTEMVEKTYVDAFDGCAYKGKLLMAYISTEAEVTADAIDRTSNFMTSWMQIKDDLAVGKVDYLETELFEGSSITLQVPVTNQSWQKLQNITVELQSSQGTAVYSQQVQLEAALESGETDYVSITVPKENLSNTEQYSVHVTSRDWSDDNASNDTVPVMLWYTDFEVNAQQMVNASEQYIQYAVTNSGNTAGTGTLVIYKKVGADRVELHSAPVSLAVGKTYTDKVRVEPNFYSDGQEGVVFVEIKPAVEELYNFNNSQSLALTQVKQSTTNDITGSEEAIPAPVMKTPSAVYDLQSGGSIAVEATENGWSFTGIQELDPSRYTYSAARLQLPEQYLQTLSVGYHYYTLTYSQKGKTSEANFILEVCDTGPKPAPLSVQDVVVTYDGMPVGLSELGYKTSSNGEVTARYRENGSWISGLPTEMGEYTVELTVGADRDNHYSATTAQFRLTVVKGTRAISVPTRITQADGSVYFADAIATAAAQDGQITYGYSLVNDAATVTEWSAQGILPKADVPTQYYVFARITGGTKYDDAVSLGYAVDAHVHGYQDTVVKPTTSAQGYTLHTCACGHSYKDSFVDKLTYIVGDVNRDGRVNTQDRILLARYLAKWIGYDAQKIDLLAADVNGDGRVNTQDRIILARYLAKWIGYEKLPADD